MPPTRKVDPLLFPYAARLVAAHGFDRVNEACLEVLGFPAFLVLNVSEAKKVERALHAKR